MELEICIIAEYEHKFLLHRERFIQICEWLGGLAAAALNRDLIHIFISTTSPEIFLSVFSIFQIFLSRWWKILI